MKRMSRETFLVNQIQYLSDSNSRSIKEFVKKGNSRADEVIVALMVERNKFYINSSIDRLAELSKEAYNYTIGVETKFEKKIIKHFDMHKHYIEKLTYKQYMTSMINDTKHLSDISNKLGLNYGNVYRFFIKNNAGALKYNTAQKVLIEKQKIEKQKRSHYE